MALQCSTYNSRIAESMHNSVTNITISNIVKDRIDACKIHIFIAS